MDALVWPFDLALILMQYRDAFGRLPNLVRPTTLNEWLQQRKLIGRDEQMSHCADKLQVRNYVAQRIGEEHLTPILWEGNSLDDPPDLLERLPSRFVLKANHGSAMNIIVTDKSKADWPSIRREAHAWLHTDFAARFAEWQYRWIEPKLFIEKFIEPPTSSLPVDYKFYCYGGRAELTLIVRNRGAEERKIFVSRDYQQLEISRSPTPEHIPPEELAPFVHFQNMRSIAETLSTGFTFVRVDLLYTNSPYFGELTFTPAAGIEPYFPKTSDKWLLSPQKKLKEPK